MQNSTESTKRVRSLQVVHSIHAPVSARSFVMPMVAYLNQAGISTQLWVENRSNQSETIADLTVPKQFVESDLVKNPLALIARLTKYRRQLRIDRPKIVHTHQTRASIIPLLAAYLEKIPVRIYQNHGLPYLGHRGLLRWFLRSLELINIKLATHVLLVSHSNLVEARVDRLIPANIGCVLASGSATGIDTSNFELDNYRGNATKLARQKLNIPESAFVLAYVGRPFKRKGFHLLLKAWQQSGLADNNNYLIIAGCTATECDRVFGYPIPGVKGLGYLNDLTEFYAACDVVTLPSEHEGFPYSLLEGAAAGKPLLGTDIPGIRCAIKDRVTGLLIPANDEIELVKAMVELAEDPDLRLNLGKSARLRIEQEFTTDIVLSSLLEFYTNELNIYSR
jgi:N,N'-diacetylbacillosaminyl-diphospho-undecaprenol alpha-1,3-N-acetylgalactosaminyltransferase